ncbi:MAG: hypothetical protein N2651_00935, partial [Fimbriimonadales bacterium]|nr:hypothetical protein [Fimbriimonadales bacterium]
PSFEPLSHAEPRREIASNPRLTDSRLKTPPFSEPSPLSGVERELRSAEQYAPFVGAAIRLVMESVGIYTTRSTKQRTQPLLNLNHPDIEENASVEPDRIDFEWSSVEHALEYRLRLTRLDGDSQTVANVSLEPTQTRFSLGKSLSPGEYELVISVALADQLYTVRRTFYVLDSERLSQLQWARAHATTHPLLSTAVFYKIDRYGEALRCLKEHAARKYPDDPQVQHWLNLVQVRVEERRAEIEIVDRSLP